MKGKSQGPQPTKPESGDETYASPSNYNLISRIKRALRYSTAEGMAGGAMRGAGDQFVSAYAVALGASNVQLSLLTSIPGVLGALAQTTSAQLVALLGTRKRVVLLFVALNGLMWLPILSIGLLSPSNGTLWLIAFQSLYTLFTLMASPPWGSIMAEVVPNRIRGRYFGWRSRLTTLANMAALFAAGGLLQLFRNHGLIGFVVVFSLAFTFRMVSLGLMTTLIELPHNPKSEEKLNPATFLRQLPNTNLGKTMLYLFSVSFVVNLAGPFFAPYMLRELNLSYLTYTILELISHMASVWSVTHWGAAADRTGNRKMLAIAGILISSVPLLWIISRNTMYLGFAELCSGLAWAGFNLVSINLIYDSTTAHNRTAYLAYFSAGGSIASSLGALTGGLLIGHLPALKGSTILSVFLLSGILRILVAAVFLPQIKEVRRVRSIPSTQLLHIMLGGTPVHRTAFQGRIHLHWHGHRGVQDASTEKKAKG